MSVHNKRKGKSQRDLKRLKTPMMIFRANIHKMLSSSHNKKPKRLLKAWRISKRPIMKSKELKLEIPT